MQDWLQTIARIELRLPFPAHFTVRPISDAEVAVRCTLMVPDAHTREDTTVNIEDIAPRETPEAGRFAMLRALIKRAVLHELDEGFLVDGAQVFGPHIAIGHPCPDHSGCRIEMINRGDYGDVSSWSCSTRRAVNA